MSLEIESFVILKPRVCLQWEFKYSKELTFIECWKEHVMEYIECISNYLFPVEWLSYPLEGKTVFLTSHQTQKLLIQTSEPSGGNKKMSALSSILLREYEYQ